MVESIAEVMSPTAQAGVILKAWACADEGRLRSELQAGLHLCTESQAIGFEEERIELLEAVLGRLNSCPNPVTANGNDPGVRLCIKLLMHLAGQSRGFDGAAASGAPIHDSI